MTKTRDRDLWDRVTKDVTPLRKKPKRAGVADAPAIPVKTPAPAKAKTAKAKTEKTPPKKPAVLPELAPGKAPGFDKRSHEKFRAGKMPIEARIDLHGYTLEAAHKELAAFIHEAAAREKRMLLVITGKGGRSKDDFGAARATLRESVPRWLNEPSMRRRILAISEAKPPHGGGGALYVLLKRKRG